MRYFLLVIALLPVFAGSSGFLSERNSYYEKYTYRMNTVYGDKASSFLPEFRETYIGQPIGNYEKFIKTGLEFEKQRNCEGRWYLRPGLYEEYEDSLFIRYRITAGGEFIMSENLYAGVQVFIENGTDNQRSFTADIQEFSQNNMMKVLGVFERGYISYRNEHFFAVFGRTDYSDMRNPSGSLLYTYNAPPVDGIWIGGGKGPFEYTFRFSYLGYRKADSTYRFYYNVEERDVIDRFIAYHSLTYSPCDCIKLTLGESAVLGRSDFTGLVEYAFPFYFFYAEQNNVKINDNILWHAGIDWNFRGIMRLNYSFLVDDYQYGYEGTKDLEPPMIGHQLRLDVPMENGNISMEAYWINAWVYNQILPWNRYEVNNANIGYADGPDMRNISLEAEYALNSIILVNAKGGIYLKGDNYTDSDWMFPIDDLYYYETHYGIAPVNTYYDTEAGISVLIRNLNITITGGYIHSITDGSSLFRINSGIRIFL